MSVRHRKPFQSEKQVHWRVLARIERLEAMKLQLHDLDNRLKMELLSLKQLSGCDEDDELFLEDDDLFQFQNEEETMEKQQLDILSNSTPAETFHVVDASLVP